MPLLDTVGCIFDVKALLEGFSAAFGFRAVVLLVGALWVVEAGCSSCVDQREEVVSVLIGLATWLCLQRPLATS